MNTKMFKSLALLGTYFVLLILVIIKIDSVIGMFHLLLATLKPLFIGIAIAFILSRLSNYYYKFLNKVIKNDKPANLISILLAYLTVFLIVLGVFWIMIPELVKSCQLLYNNISNYFSNFEIYMNDLAVKYNLKEIDFTAFKNIDSLVKDYVAKALTTVTGIMPQIMKTTSSIVSVLATIFISFILSVYLMLGKNKILSQIATVTRTYLKEKYCSKLSYVLSIINDTFSKYIVGQTTEACILGTLCFIGMLIFRFDYPLLISVLIAITALIPVLGAYIGGGVSAFLLLIISPIQALWFLIFLIVLQQFESNIIYPKVVGESIGLPAIWVLLSVTVFGGLFGFIGMLIGVPSATVIYRLIRNDVIKRNNKQKLS